jgi:hypothetical protein
MYYLRHTLTLSITLVLAACGGGSSSVGNPTTPTTPTTPAEPPPKPSATLISGVASAGLISNADVNIFDATTYINASTSKPIATSTTGTDGSYTAKLPVGFSKSLLIRVTGKIDGSTSVKDEVFGPTSVNSSFVLESVVPTSEVKTSKGKIVAHVTAYTQAMATFVANKFGQSDIDTAIDKARTLVSAKITDGADPLTTLPTKPQMLALLASASNIAKATSSTATTDPYNCANLSGNQAKISCTIKTISGIIQPLTKISNASGTATLNLNHASALNNAAKNLDIATVATNTGVDSAVLSTAKNDIVSALEVTKTEAFASSPSEILPFLAVPDLWIRVEMADKLIITSGPKAGVYQGWSYTPMLCFAASNCKDLNIHVTVTAQDLFDDPNAVNDAEEAVQQALNGVNNILHELRAKAPYPPYNTIQSVVTNAIQTGLNEQSVSAGINAAQTGFAAAGFPTNGSEPPVVEGTSTPASATPAQISAAQECAQSSSYKNPDSVPYNPQIDSNCQLAQFDACLHKETGITNYDTEGRAACKVVNGLISSLNTTWSCKYCPYPY